MKYECKLCNYETTDYGNYTKHTKTGKHITNQEKFDKRSQARKKVISDKDKTNNKLDNMIMELMANVNILKESEHTAETSAKYLNMIEKFCEVLIEQSGAKNDK